MNVDSGAVHRLPIDGVSALAFDDSGEQLLTASIDGVELWDPYAPKAPKDAVKEGVIDVYADFAALSRDGRILLVEWDVPPRVVDPKTGGKVELDREEQGSGTSAPGRGGFSPDGRSVVSTAGREAIVWNSRSGRVLSRLVGHTGDVNAAVFSGDGRFIATAGGDAAVRVWNAGTGESLAVLHPHAGPVGDVAFSPSGEQILSTGVDGGVRLSPCYVCLSTDELKSLLSSRITRAFTREERLAFLGASG